jgi:tRNA pseudouridine55 synthase
MATGLLIIAVDKDTKRLGEFLWADKTYLATIDLSKKSDTRDAEYRETYEELDIKTLVVPTIEQIQTTLNTLIPSASLPLPPFSAKKINGQKRYDLARKGEQEIVRQDMKINSYTILDYNFPEIKIQINVWSGTYIRSIAYRLWTKLHTGGILTQLQRTQIKGIHLTKGAEQKDGLSYSVIEVPEAQSK